MAKIKPKLVKKAEELPSPGTGEPADRLRNMCSHGLISGEHADEVIHQVKCGHKTVEGAIEELQESCSCGLFLPSRARRILNSAAKPS